MVSEQGSRMKLSSVCQLAPFTILRPSPSVSRSSLEMMLTSAHSGVCAVAGRMLNRQDHDLFGRFFDDVVDKVLVAARDQLSDASHLLLSADARKKDKSPQRSHDGGAHAKRRFRVLFTDIVCNVVEILFRLAREAQL